MNIAVYARKSKLTEKGESIANQISACKKYIELNYPNSYIYVFEDEGFSGGNTDRPQFNNMQNKIKENKFDIIISYKLDRVSRSINDFADFVSMLDKYNVSYVSLKEQFDTSSPMGRAMMYIIAVFAQLERETIAERITDNFTGLASTGRYLASKAPEGFDKKQIEYTDKNGIIKKFNILTINESESKKIKLIFEKYLEIESIKKLEQFLIKNNIKNRNGNFYNCIGIKRILTHPDYMIADSNAYEYFNKLSSNILSLKEDFNSKHGVTVLRRSSKNNTPKNWLISVGYHEGIITSESWIKTQNIIESRLKHKTRLPKGKYDLLCGILICKKCNGFLRAMGRKENGQFYYCCTTKEKTSKVKCNIKNIRGDLLDENVLKKINTILFDKEIILNKLNEKSSLKSYIAENNFNELTKIKTEIQKKQSTVKALILKLSEIKDNVTIQYITEEINCLNDELKALKFNLSKADNNTSSPNLNQIYSILNNTNELLFKTELHKSHETRNMLKSILKSITYDENEIIISFKTDCSI